MTRDPIDYSHEDALREKLADAENELTPKCQWCRGRGYEYVDGVAWRCPDCMGTGETITEEEDE